MLTPIFLRAFQIVNFVLVLLGSPQIVWIRSCFQQGLLLESIFLIAQFAILLCRAFLDVRSDKHCLAGAGFRSPEFILDCIWFILLLTTLIISNVFYQFGESQVGRVSLMIGCYLALRLIFDLWDVAHANNKAK